jgi:hypothetical protein
MARRLNKIRHPGESRGLPEVAAIDGGFRLSPE